MHTVGLFGFVIWLLANVHFDNGLLGYFLNYYETRGVERFGIIWHCDIVPSVLNRPEIAIRQCNEPYISGPVDNDLLNEMRLEYLNEGDWYIPADLDEFHWHPGLSNFGHFIGDYDYIPSLFVDRVAQDGTLRPLDCGRSLDEQFPLVVPVTARICGGPACINKVAMARHDCIVSSGHHFATGIGANFTMQTHHFKWNSGLWSWLMFREGKYINEVTTFNAHYQRFGRINVYDSELGVQIAPKIGI